MSRPVDYATLTERTCSICGETKSVSEFNKYNDTSAPITGWRYYSRCRDCNKQLCSDYGKNNRKRRNDRLRQWRHDNPQLARKLDRRKRLKKKYGMTPEDYTAMYRKQEGKCLICNRFFGGLVVDHDHVTGEVRGLLCRKCNGVLGWIETMNGVWEKLHAYLDQPCHADVLLELANE